MFPELIPVKALKNVDQGSDYLVGEVKNKTFPTVRPSELVGKFNGLNALFEYQQAKQPVPKNDGESDARARENFHYYPNYREAVETYRNNPASVSEFKEMTDYLNGGEANGRELVYEVQGDFIDMGRFMEGEPECFGSLTDGNPTGKRVQIVVNLSAVHYVNKADILKRSARILRLVDWLESQGIRTAVLGMISHQCIHLEVALKHFDEPLNITDLAVMAHSDFLRRILFRFMEYSKTFSSGYGSAVALDGQYNPKDWESEYANEYTVYIGNQYERFDDGKIDREFDKLETLLTELLSGARESDQPNQRVVKIL